MQLSFFRLNENLVSNAFTAVGALRVLIDFYSVYRQTILLVNGEPLGSERARETVVPRRWGSEVLKFGIKEGSNFHREEITR